MACRKEGGSFLLFKIRLRVIHREGKGKKRVRERGSSFSLDFPMIGP